MSNTPPLLNSPHEHRHSALSRLFSLLRTSFLTGIVVIAPIALTMWLFWAIIDWIDSWMLPLIPEKYQPEEFLGMDIHGVGVLFFLVSTCLIGWIARGVIGRSLLGFAERIVDRMPVVRSVYNGVKQIAETVFAQTETTFDKSCLIQYPRPGLWAIAFISTSTKGEISRKLSKDKNLLSVFLPTTPNPTSGFLLFVPEDEIILLDMKIEDAAKLVISAGLVYPGDKQLTTKEPSPPPQESS